MLFSKVDHLRPSHGYCPHHVWVTTMRTLTEKMAEGTPSKAHTNLHQVCHAQQLKLCDCNCIHNRAATWSTVVVLFTNFRRFDRSNNKLCNQVARAAGSCTSVDCMYMQLRIFQLSTSPHRVIYHPTRPDHCFAHWRDCKRRVNHFTPRLSVELFTISPHPYLHSLSYPQTKNSCRLARQPYVCV